VTHWWLLTWLVRKENEVAFQRAEMRMVICDIKVKDRFPSNELREGLGVDDVISVLQQKQVAMVWACVAKRR